MIYFDETNDTAPCMMTQTSGMRKSVIGFPAQSSLRGLRRLIRVIPRRPFKRIDHVHGFGLIQSKTIVILT
jgi:hypothetical protein